MIHLTIVLNALPDNKLYVNLKKCHHSPWERKNRIFGPSGVGQRHRGNWGKIIGMVTQSVKEFKGCLSLTKYYRCFVLNYIEILRPLFDLLKNDASFGVRRRLRLPNV